MQVQSLDIKYIESRVQFCFARPSFEQVHREIQPTILITIMCRKKQHMPALSNELVNVKSVQCVFFFPVVHKEISKIPRINRHSDCMNYFWQQVFALWDTRSS